MQSGFNQRSSKIPKPSRGQALGKHRGSAPVWIGLTILLLGLGGGWFAWRQLAPSVDKLQPRDSAPSDIREGQSALLSIQEIDSPIHVPFVLTPANNISIRVTLNDSEPLTLMFHTAADSVFLTKEAVKKLKEFKISESVEMEAWGGTASAGVSTGNRLSMGSLRWEDQTIFIDEYSGPETDGKFGPNLFAEKVLEINFDRQELVIHPRLPDLVSEAKSAYRRIDYTQQQGSMYLTGNLLIGDQRVENQFMLHTGFGGTALLDDKFVQSHQLAKRLETLSERELKDSFGNPVKTRTVRLSSIELAGFKLVDTPIEIFDGNLGQQNVSVLGGGLIKRLNMIIDPVHRHIYLSPSRLFEKPVEQQ